MTKSRKSFYDRVNINKVLEHRRQVAVIWGTEDVQERRPDLTEDQAWEVLVECRHVHDCNYGFNWELIDMIADDLFPAPDDLDSSEEED